MIVSRILARGRVTIPPEVREALALKAGDTLNYETDGNRVFVTKGVSGADEHGEDLLTDAELEPIIDAALADIGETYTADEVFGDVRAHIESLRGRADAA